MEPAEVRYRVLTRDDARPVGSPIELTWPRVPAPGWGEGGSGHPAQLRLRGGALSCRVAERAAGLEVWTAVRRDGRPAFPGVVKVIDRGEVVVELVAVE